MLSFSPRNCTSQINGSLLPQARRSDEHGAVDGAGDAARFHFPADIAVAPDGTVSTIADDLGSADDIDQNYGTDGDTALAPQLDGSCKVM